jgi:hypothetical protein
MSDIELSPRGRQRREQILEMVIRQSRQRRRRRLAIRGGAVGIVLVVVSIALLRIPRSTPHPSDAPMVKSVPRAAPAPLPRQGGKVVIERIQTDPTIVRRLAVPKSPPRWQTLDDDQLLQELAQAGRPAGLVKIDGRTTLVYHRPVRGP